jgi:hypothetical protein
VQNAIGLCQNEEQDWAKDVRVILFFPTEQEDYTPTNPKVSFKIYGKIYTARELRYNTFIFDSIPMKEGTIYLKSKGFQTQWYTIMPWNKKIFNYTLGRSGCKYTYQDNYLYPYYDRPKTIAVQIGGIEKDSIIDKMTPFFDSLNLKIEFKLINRHNNIVHLTTKDDLHKTIFKLLDHPNIVDAGELCLSMPWLDGLVIPTRNMGFFSTEFGFEFTQGVSNSDRDRDSLIQAYNLEFLRRSGSCYTVRLTKDSPGTTTEIIKSLFNEEYIEMISLRIKEYEQPKINE